MSGAIGPSLPPGFTSRSSSDEEESDSEPKNAVIGPTLPSSSNNGDSSSRFPSETTRIGPMPVQKSSTSHSTEESVGRSFGPVLPPEFQTRTSPSPPAQDVGAPRPASGHTPSSSEGDSSSDEEIIGPMPSEASLKVRTDLATKREEIESRSQAMKDKLLGKSSKEAAAPKREEWMTELPSEYKPLGIGPRKFRTHVPEGGDRSVWTDTPEDKRRKAEEALSGCVRKEEGGRGKKRELASVLARQEELAKQVEQYNKDHRSESLMDMHRKKRKEELKAKGGVTERRPFDRERDLEAPRSLVTPAKRMALTKDSKLSLDSKFQHGSRSFL